MTNLATFEMVQQNFKDNLMTIKQSLQGNQNLIEVHEKFFFCHWIFHSCDCQFLCTLVCDKSCFDFCSNFNFTATKLKNCFSDFGCLPLHFWMSKTADSLKTTSCKSTPHMVILWKPKHSGFGWRLNANNSCAQVGVPQTSAIVSRVLWHPNESSHKFASFLFQKKRVEVEDLLHLWDLCVFIHFVRSI